VWRPPARSRSAAIRRATPVQILKFRRFNGLAEAARVVMPAASFSQMRGTPRKMVGCTSRRFWVTVSIDSAKLTTQPADRLNHTE